MTVNVAEVLFAALALSVVVAFLTIPKWFLSSYVRRSLWILRDNAFRLHRETGEDLFAKFGREVENSIRMMHLITPTRLALTFLVFGGKKSSAAKLKGPNAMSKAASSPHFDQLNDLNRRFETLRAQELVLTSWSGLLLAVTSAVWVPFYLARLNIRTSRPDSSDDVQKKGLATHGKGLSSVTTSVENFHKVARPGRSRHLVNA